MFDNPERIEEMLVHAEFNTTGLSKEDRERLEDMFNVKIPEDGNVTVDYPFNLYYFNIIGQFTMFLDMLDKAAIVTINTEEIRHNKCLLQELFCRFEQLEKKYT